MKEQTTRFSLGENGAENLEALMFGAPQEYWFGYVARGTTDGREWEGSGDVIALGVEAALDIIKEELGPETQIRTLVYHGPAEMFYEYLSSQARKVTFTSSEELPNTEVSFIEAMGTDTLPIK